MSELRDSFIKLFGKTIAFPPNDCVADAAASDQNVSSASDSEKPEQELEENQDNSIDQEVSKEHSDEPSKHNQEDDSSEKVMTKNNDNPKTPSADVEASLLKTSKNGEEDEGDDKAESDAQDKTLKKPDKILPCPRCTSMDTKFCYYNNYNVNQPRHFCKNCQRYWTAGGTMRKIPVGAGRRKNKNATASSHYRHIMVSEALQMARMTNNTVNGSVLTFGSDEKSQHRVVQNVFLRPDDDHSSGCGSSVTASNSSERVQESTIKCFPPQVQCFPRPPWPCPWNSVQYHSPIPQAAYPVPFYPPYWGCTVPGSWNVPLAPPNPTVLGKHSRDGKEDPTSESNSGRSVLIPKTLRIDDPSEAAKSSIWVTLGIRNEKTSSMSGGGLFKSFQSGNDKDQAMGASAAMHANPAALSRSLNFQENT